MRAGLCDRWRGLWARAGCTGDGVAAFNDLVRRYAEPHRAYHTLEHIAACLVMLDNCAADALPEQAATAIELGLWFHDAVYDARAGDNEEQSARLAEAILTAAGLAPEIVRRVAACVRVTAPAAEPAAPDEALTLDIDLSILGEDQATFAAYERQVRREYDWVPEAEFRAARTAILRGFLERPHIYSTPWFQRRLETPARANLRRSIAALAATAG